MFVDLRHSNVVAFETRCLEDQCLSTASLIVERKLKEIYARYAGAFDSGKVGRC